MNLAGEKGLILVIVLGVVLLLAVTAVAFMFISNSEIRIVGRQTDSTKALYLAEAGTEQVRIRLGQDWNDHSPLSDISLGDGAYSVSVSTLDSSGAALPSDELRVTSTGEVNGALREVEVILKSISSGFSGISGVTAAIEAEGSISIQSQAVTIDGDQIPNSSLDFEATFGLDKTEMEGLVAEYCPETYYETAFNNDVAIDGENPTLTWVSAPGEESQITFNNWVGKGILIVEGDLKITGGTFDGIIWVIGSLRISGNPVISGGIFAESGVLSDTSISGTATIIYSSASVEDASSTLTSIVISSTPEIKSWREVF